MALVAPPPWCVRQIGFRIISSAALAASPTLVWRHAADDVHVATVDGEFAGFVVEAHGRFIAHNAHSRRLASTATVGDARAVVATASAPPRSVRRLSRRPARIRPRGDAVAAVTRITTLVPDM